MLSVFRSIVLSSVVVGLIVGGAVTLVQHLGTVPLIQKAEVYEEAAEKAAAPAVAAPAAGAPVVAAHEHPAAAWEPKAGFERNAYTALANMLTATGFALLLAGIFTLRARPVGWREGLLWGLAGFAVFTLAPGLGLPPELPGIPAAPLESRQLWWIATAASTAGGLALLVFNRALWAAGLGLGLIVLPHLVGAPQAADGHSNVPEALSRQFVTAVTLTSLVFWAMLGTLTAAVQRRFARGA